MEHSLRRSGSCVCQENGLAVNAAHAHLRESYGTTTNHSQRCTVQPDINTELLCDHLLVETCVKLLSIYWPAATLISLHPDYNLTVEHSLHHQRGRRVFTGMKHGAAVSSPANRRRQGCQQSQSLAKTQDDITDENSQIRLLHELLKCLFAHFMFHLKLFIMISASVITPTTAYADI